MPKGFFQKENCESVKWRGKFRAFFCLSWLKYFTRIEVNSRRCFYSQTDFKKKKTQKKTASSGQKRESKVTFIFLCTPDEQEEEKIFYFKDTPVECLDEIIRELRFCSPM